MRPSGSRKRVIRFVPLAAVLLLPILAWNAAWADNPSGDRPAVTACAVAPTCLEELLAMPWCELEALYRASPPGPVPDCFYRGGVVYPPCERFSKLRQCLAGLMWKGKHFCAAECRVTNQWCFGRVISGRLYYGQSWLDGGPAIILDYQGVSRLWNDARDEIRQVGPGLYVGAMYLRRCPEPRLKLLVVLQACDGCF